MNAGAFAMPDNRTMHLLIPFAFCQAPACAQALSTLKLPRLEKLLRLMRAQATDSGDPFSLSTPHERALAQALALPVRDGLIPWAAHHASASDACAFIHPCHWTMGNNHMTMGDWPLADFSEAESRELMAAMQPYFEEDGIQLSFDNSTRWLARGAVFTDLASASLDRVIGRNLEHWMPRDANAASLRRLQNEMQMLLYTHPVNERRAANGLVLVNSFWLSGTGTLARAEPARASTLQPLVVDALRQAALHDDWAAWALAWQQVDATHCANLAAAISRQEPCQLTLCGERHAQTFEAETQNLLTKFRALFAPACAIQTLRHL